MEVDWPYPEKGNIRNMKDSLKIDSTWKKKKRSAKETWRTSVEKMKDQGWPWGMVQQMSADMQKWRSSVKALCALDIMRTK